METKSKSKSKVNLNLNLIVDLPTKMKQKWVFRVKKTRFGVEKCDLLRDGREGVVEKAI